MATPFDGFGFTDAQQTVSAANMGGAIIGLAVAPIIGGGIADSSSPGTRGDFGSSVALIRAMLDGDMWANGIGWIGPRPQPTEIGYTETMQILMQGFVSTNTLADCRDRHVAGVLGNEPNWGLTVRRSLKKEDKPTAEEQKLIDEGEAFLTEWWDGRKVHTLLMDATATLLAGKRSPLRLYVPRGKLQAVNRQDEVTGRARTVKEVPVAQDDIAGALSVIWPEHPAPERATVAEDPDTKESLGVVLYNVGRTVKATTAGEEVAEMTYLVERKDPEGRPLTIIRQSGSSGRGAARIARATTPGAGDTAPPPPADRGAAMLRLGGRLPLYEMTRHRFITAQMVQLQRALNLSMTALPRNVITSGWLERIISNAQMPGKWVNDSELKSGKRWVPDKHTTGAGVTTYLKGIRNTDVGEGTTTYATPSVTFRPPAPVEPTVGAQEALYRAILREAKQEHVLVAQATAASDKSREQARADFEMTLRPTAAAVNAAGRWLIETVLSMAEEFANVPGKYTGKLRATFECHIDTGPITSDERTSIDGSVKAGTLSVETAMTLERVADPAAEMARINTQPGAQLAIAERQLTAIGTAATQGLDIEGAAAVVGLDAAEAAGLVPEFDPNAPDPNADPAVPPAGGPPGGPPAPRPKNGPKVVPDPAPKNEGGGGSGGGNGGGA